MFWDVTIGVAMYRTFDELDLYKTFDVSQNKKYLKYLSIIYYKLSYYVKKKQCKIFRFF